MTASEQETRRQIENCCKRQEVITENEKQANGKNEKQGKKKRYESINIRNEDMENEEEKQVSRWSHVGA